MLPDLIQPYLIETECPYENVATVTLCKMDYNNFCTDMVADRQFIEDYSDLCGTGTMWIGKVGYVAKAAEVPSLTRFQVV